ncbi:MAG TPA: glycosyltransferase family 87 protein [Chthoniobacterales bacterium]
MNNRSRLLKLPSRRESSAGAAAGTTSQSGRIRLEAIALAVWGVVLAAIFVRVALHPERNSVFGVFRLAGERWLHGEPLYPRAGQFLYSPLAAAIFSAFARLPEPAGSLVWRAANMAPYLFLAYAWMRRTHRDASLARGIGWFVLLAFSWGNLNNGQASPLVIAFICTALWAAAGRRWNVAACLIAGATYFKLYPLAFGLLLGVLYPRQILWRLAVAITLLFLLSLLPQPAGYALAQYQAWFSSLGADSRRVTNGVGTWRDLWLLLRLVKVPVTVSQYAFIQGLGGVGVAVFCGWAQRIKRWEAGRLLYTLLALGSCWVVLLGPATELATYIFLAPAFTVASVHLWKVRQGGFSPQQLTACALLSVSFVWLVVAEVLNAWVPAVRRSVPLHALQPIGAAVFAAFVILWLLDDRWWLPSPGLPAPSSRLSEMN